MHFLEARLKRAAVDYLGIISIYVYILQYKLCYKLCNGTFTNSFQRSHFQIPFVFKKVRLENWIVVTSVKLSEETIGSRVLTIGDKE